MALLQKAISYYYPQCSGMSAVLDDDDVERGNGSVTPLRYAPYRRSRAPSVTDLTGIREKVSSTAVRKSCLQSTVAAKAKPRTRSTVAIEVRPPRNSTATRSQPRSAEVTVHSSANLLTSTVISMPDAIENENYLGNVDAINAVV